MDENKLRIAKRSEIDEWIKKVCIEQNICGAQQPCGDAIGREDMLDAIGHGTTYTSEELQRIIKGLPPVTPQLKTGHWKRISMDKYSEHAKYWYRCDRCGKDNLGDTDWCPNCGCRMVEPQESEG